MPDHQQDAIDAVIAEVKEHSWLTVPDEGSECACGFALTEFPLEYAGDAYWQHVASCLIAAAEPHLRKKWAEEIIDYLDTARAIGRVYTYSAIQDLILEGAGE